jgi:chaperonin GroEL (HSP60 family)
LLWRRFVKIYLCLRIKNFNISIGAAEMLMATAISQLAEKTPGKESIAIESFAHALRQVIERIV